MESATDGKILTTNLNFNDSLMF